MGLMQNEQEEASSQQSPTNAEDTAENKQPSFATEKMENTPFTLIMRDETWEAVMGDHVVTQKFNSKTELIKHINKKPWMLITTMIIAMNDIRENLKAQQIKQ